LAAASGDASVTAGQISANSSADTYGTNGTAQLTANNPTNGPSGIAFNSNAGAQGARIQTNPLDSNTLEVTDQAGTVLSAWKGANFAAAGSITPGLMAVPATACSTPGAMGQNSDGDGQILVCQYGEWTPLGGWDVRIGHYDVGGTRSNLVPVPYCGSGPHQGTPLVSVTIEDFYVNTTATINSSAPQSGSNYVVQFTNGSGQSVYSDVQAIAVTYCSYGTP
jgi:hypothetical protein